MGRISPVFVAAGVGIWLGAMLFLSFVLAPAAFATIESRQLAGDLVARALNILYLSAYVLGPLLVLVRVLGRPPGRQRLWAVQVILLILMTASTLVSREIVGTKLLELRRAMGSVMETGPRDDPRRLLFQQWHQFSVLLMLFNIAAAAAVLALVGVEGRRYVSRNE